ncbi:MAG: hypothetical protein KBD78_07035 [Oligoflexales bacterium]|nr:hypothetical protein [Oligoflexales bacterium]
MFFRSYLIRTSIFLAVQIYPSLFAGVDCELRNEKSFFASRVIQIDPNIDSINPEEFPIARLQATNKQKALEIAKMIVCKNSSKSSLEISNDLRKELQELNDSKVIFETNYTIKDYLDLALDTIEEDLSAIDFLDAILDYGYDKEQINSYRAYDLARELAKKIKPEAAIKIYSIFDEHQEYLTFNAWEEMFVIMKLKDDSLFEYFLTRDEIMEIVTRPDNTFLAGKFFIKSPSIRRFERMIEVGMKFEVGKDFNSSMCLAYEELNRDQVKYMFDNNLLYLEGSDYGKLSLSSCFWASSYLSKMAQLDLISGLIKRGYYTESWQNYTLLMAAAHTWYSGIFNDVEIEIVAERLKELFSLAKRLNLDLSLASRKSIVSSYEHPESLTLLEQLKSQKEYMAKYEKGHIRTLSLQQELIDYLKEIQI